MKVWRYMNLPKLISFLESGSLYFARADLLGDPYEGTWDIQTIAERERELDDYSKDIAENFSADQLRQMSREATKILRESVYVNCWHGGDSENLAMWKMYGTETGSVALQSRYETLANTIPDNIEIGNGNKTEAYMGMVQYISYRNPEKGIPRGNALYPFIYKRNEFQHEKEVRIFIWASDNIRMHYEKELKSKKPLGFAIEIDVKKAIESIRVQPTAPEWIKETIENLLERYGWKTRVTSSDIDIAPLY